MKKLLATLTAVMFLLAVGHMCNAATIDFGGITWEIYAGNAFINGNGNLVLEAPDSTGSTTSGQLRLNPTPSDWRYPSPDNGSWYRVSFIYDDDDMFHTRALGSGYDASYGVFWPAPHWFGIQENGTWFYQYDLGNPVDGTEYTMGIERTSADQVNYYFNGELLSSGATTSNISLIDLKTYKRWVDSASVGGQIEITDFELGTGPYPTEAPPDYGTVVEADINDNMVVENGDFAEISADYGQTTDPCDPGAIEGDSGLSPAQTLAYWKFDTVSSFKYVDTVNSYDLVYQNGSQSTNTATVPNPDPLVGATNPESACAAVGFQDDVYGGLFQTMDLDWTMEGFVKLDPCNLNMGESWNVICGTRQQAAEWTGWSLFYNTDNSALSVYNVGPLGSFSLSGPDIADNQWHHVAIVWQAEVWPTGKMSLFVDGAFMDSGMGAGIMPAADEGQELVFGGRRTTSGFISENTGGCLDEWRFSRGALMPDEFLYDQGPAYTGVCGDLGYLAGDIYQDCYVDMLDVAKLAFHWLGEHGGPSVYWELDGDQTAAYGNIDLVGFDVNGDVVALVADPSTRATISNPDATTPWLGNGDDSATNPASVVLDPNNLPHNIVVAAEGYGAFGLNKDHSFTVEGYFKIEEFASDGQGGSVLFCTRSADSDWAGFMLRALESSGRKVNLYVDFRDGYSWSVTSISAVPQGEWFHYALVWDAGEQYVRLFLNGNLDGQYNFPTDLPAGDRGFAYDTRLQIGGNDFTDTIRYYWKGNVDEVRWVDRALDASELLVD